MWDILQEYWLLLLVGQFPNGPLGGLAVTLLLATVGLVAAFPLAVLGGIALTSSSRPVRTAAATLVNSIRGLPLLMIIFWAYFAVPLLIGRTVSALTTMICALIIYECSYLSQIVASGIRSVARGQTEAARSLGLSHANTLRDVILPQALRNMLPSILNQFISLVKNTSIGYIIGVHELTNAASQINAQVLTQPLEIYGLLAAIYFVLCFSLSRGVNALEKRLSSA